MQIIEAAAITATQRNLVSETVIRHCVHKRPGEKYLLAKAFKQ